MFKIIILTSLLLLTVTMASFSECEETKQLENTCGKFCFKVVKPMIEHMTALQKKVNSYDENGNAEQSNFIKDIEQKLGIAENKISVLERKLESEKKNIDDKLEQKFKLFEQKLIVAEEKILEQSKLNKNLSEKIALLESEKNEKLKEQQQNNEQSSLKKIIEEKFHIAENLIAVLESGNKIKQQQIAVLERKFGESEQKNKSLSELNYTKRLKNLQYTSFKIGSQHYYRSEEKLNWFEAAHRCVELGGHLASPQNEYEYNALRGNLNKYRDYWIDINDISEEGKYVSLTTGKNTSYLKWSKDEPNGGNQENCIYVYADAFEQKMNDHSCSFNTFYVCQLFSE